MQLTLHNSAAAGPALHVYFTHQVHGLSSSSSSRSLITRVYQHVCSFQQATMLHQSGSNVRKVSTHLPPQLASQVSCPTAVWVRPAGMVPMLCWAAAGLGSGSSTVLPGKGQEASSLAACQSRLEGAETEHTLQVHMTYSCALSNSEGVAGFL